MTLSGRPAPLTDIVSVRDMFDRLFDERFFRPIGLTEGECELKPALDVFTRPEDVVAKVACPASSRTTSEITISDDLVTVSGSFKEEHETEEKGYLRRELSRGAFHRSFTVPAAVKADDAKAVFKDGVLTLTMPRTEEIKPRHVRIETS